MGFSDSEMSEIFNFISGSKSNFDYSDFKKAIYGKELTNISSLIFVLDERIKTKDREPVDYFYRYQEQEIGFEEFAMCMIEIDASIKYEEIDLLFCKLDENDSARVSKEEFRKIFEEYTVFVDFKKHIVEYAQEKGVGMQHVFYQMNTSDTMMKDEFFRIARTVTSEKMSDGEIERLFSQLDTNKDGTISKTELSEIYNLTQKQLYNMREFLTFKNSVIAYCESQQISLSELYNNYSPNGTFNRDSIKKIVDLVISNPKFDISILKTILDKNFDNRIEYAEFKNAILGDDIVLEDLVSTVRRIINMSRLTIDSIFERYDRDRNENLDHREFVQFMHDLVPRLNFAQIESLFEFMNYNRNPQITRDEIFTCLMFKGKSNINFLKIIEEFKLSVLFIDSSSQIKIEIPSSFSKRMQTTLEE